MDTSYSIHKAENGYVLSISTQPTEPNMPYKHVQIVFTSRQLLLRKLKELLA